MDIDDQMNIGPVTKSAQKNAVINQEPSFVQEMIQKHNNEGHNVGMGNIGPYIIQNNKQLAQQVVQGVPNAKLFTQIHGSSSATNKAKKAFNFELDNQQKMKREKNKG